MSGQFPVPWRAERFEPATSVGETAVRVVAANGAEIVSNEDFYPAAVPEELAPLISAAPDLLDALYRALPFVEDALDDPAFKTAAVQAVIGQIKAAISKAESEVK